MSQQYLLPCPCGNQIAISTSQAGGQVTCQCGKIVSVPTLGGIKKLSSLKQVEIQQPEPWNLLKGWMFVGGLLLATFGVYFGITALRKASHLHNKGYVPLVQAEKEDELEWTKKLDQTTPEQLLEYWDKLRNLSLGDTHEPMHKVVKNVESTERMKGYIGLGCGLVGAVIFIASLIPQQRTKV
jgi:hypothetical protein